MSPLFLSLSIAACAIAADLPQPVMKDGLADYFAGKGTERAKEQAALKLKSAEAELALAKKGRIEPGRPDTYVVRAPAGSVVLYPSRKARDAYIKERELDVKEAKDRLTRKLVPLPPPLLLDTMKAGVVGELTFGEYSSYGGPPFVTVVQVIDKGNMIVRFDEATLWIEHDTTGLVDDASVSVANICWHVVGTKTYPSTDGATKTVFHLAPLKQ